MPLPEFSYVRPGNLADALALAAEHGDSAKFLAGGQTLVPLLQMRLARPAVVIDIGHLKELQSIEVTDTHLRIGALVRHRDVAENETVRRQCPLLAEAAGHIGHAHIRNRGTIGGSLAHADPCAEYPTVVTVMDARMETRSLEGLRLLPPEEFFIGPLMTSLITGELVTAVEFPLNTRNCGWSFREVVRRSGDFGLIVVAVRLLLDPSGERISEAAIAAGGAGPVPLRLRRAEGLLIGRRPDLHLFEEAAATGTDELEPEDDILATAAYRRALARVHIRDGLAEALARAKG